MFLSRSTLCSIMELSLLLMKQLLKYKLEDFVMLKGINLKTRKLSKKLNNE
jgi:hypothetical protein